MTDSTHRNALPGAAAWAIQPEALAAIDARTLTRLQAEQASKIGAFANEEEGSIAGGKVAVISLSGVITPHGSFILRLLGLGGGGLDGFRSTLKQAVADDDVQAIVLNVDSPGGLVSLVPETAAEIREAREEKPIVAVANTMAASAAYYLASQATEVVVTPSGEVGSIGVLWRHEDFSRMDEMMGVKTTLIFAGKYKTEGNPFEPLSDSARESMQATVDDFYGMFTADVAAGRGVKEKAVREGFGEGRMALAEQAVELGMADSVATLEETVERLGNESGGAGGSSAKAAETTPAPEATPPADSGPEAEVSETEETPPEAEPPTPPAPVAAKPLW